MPAETPSNPTSDLPPAQSLVDIVGEAMRLPPDRRAEFVNASCPDQSRRDEAMSLIASLADAGGFMDRPTVDSTTHHAFTSDEQPGAVIGRYTLLRKIGEGGFGVVFAAQQGEPLRRVVALKIIKLGMDTRAVVARFEQERQSLALMDHPGIARVLDAGATAAGRPYFVMDLVEGVPITTYCDGAQLSIPERLQLFAQVCQAVQHAHTKGIIHRDLKPGNVLVVPPEGPEDGPGRCKVIDFGIAKAISHSATEKTVFTEQRQLIGTPEYMSPEQAEGSHDVDTRSDVYALGVLLYELLAGVTPLDPQRLRSAAFGEMQRIIREVDPPAPSTRLTQLPETLASVAAMRRSDPGRLGTVLRGELDWIVMRALEKERARRYASPGDLAADVARYVSGDPVLAAPPSAAYRARKFVVRHSVGVTAGACVLAALIVGLGVALWQADVARRERDAANAAKSAALAAKADADEQRKRVEQVADFQEAQLEGLDAAVMGGRLRDLLLADARAGMERAGLPSDQIATRQLELASLLQDANLTNVSLKTLDQTIFSRSIEAVDKKFENQPEVRARLLQSIASTMKNVGLIEGAAAPQNEALAIRREKLGDDHPDTLESLGASTSLLLDRGRLPEAEAALRDALARMRRVLGPENVHTIRTMNNLALALQRRGEWAEAETIFREAVEAADKSLGPDHSATICARGNLGVLYYSRGKIAQAEELFKEALKASMRVNGPDHEGTLSPMSNLATVYEVSGNHPRAEELYRAALEGSRRAHGDDHPATLTLMYKLGGVLRAEGKLDEAEILTRESLTGRTRVLTADHPDTLESMNSLGLLLRSQKKFDQAEAVFRENLQRRKRVLGPENEATQRSVASLAGILQLRGHTAEAEPLLREVLAFRRRTLEPDHPLLLGSMYELAGDLVALGNLSEAEPLLREAIAGRERKFGKDNPDVGMYRDKLAELLMRRGEYAEAETMLLEVERIFGLGSEWRHRHADTVRHLSELYRAWDKREPGRGHREQAALWTAQMAAGDAPGSGSTPEGRPAPNP